MHRAERAQLVPGLLPARMPPVGAQPARELGQDPRVVARIARRFECLSNALNAPLGVRHGALGLAPGGGGGEHDVGHRGGLREEDVLHDQQVEAVEQAPCMVQVRLGLRGVLPDHVQVAQVAAVHRLEHLGEVPAVVRVDRHAPCGLEAVARGPVVL